MPPTVARRVDRIAPVSILRPSSMSYTKTQQSERSM